MVRDLAKNNAVNEFHLQKNLFLSSFKIKFKIQSNYIVSYDVWFIQINFRLTTGLRRGFDISNESLILVFTLSCIVWNCKWSFAVCDTDIRTLPVDKTFNGSMAD